MSCYQNKTLVFFISAGIAYLFVINMFGGEAEPKTVSDNQLSSERDGKGSRKNDTARNKKLSFCDNNEWKTKKVLKNIII